MHVVPQVTHMCTKLAGAGGVGTPIGGRGALRPTATGKTGPLPDTSTGDGDGAGRMTHPPQPPGAGGPGAGARPSHDATQAFPAGGAPPPPPPSAGGAPVGSAPAEPDPTLVSPSWGAGPVATGPAPVSPGPAPVAPGPAPAATPWTAPAPGHEPAVPAPATGGRSTGRILGRAVVVLVVVGLLAATTAWGFVNRRSAEQWRDRSEAAEADLARSLERVESTQVDLAAAQVRLRELANEKAGEVDQNRVLSEIVAQAPEVTAALAECQAETAALANDLIAAFGDPEGADVADLRERTDEVNDICGDALAQAESLEDTIDGLG